MRFFVAACALAALSIPALAGESGPAAFVTPVAADLPAGTYTLDKSHSTLVFRVSHLGFSFYTATFDRFDAKMELDPADPTSTKLEATIDPTSLDLPEPPEGFLSELLGAKWLNASAFPQMTYRSTSVELTGPNSARISGDFTFNGVTKPVVFEATFNGGYAGHPLDPQARIGFSAKGSLQRSEFGVSTGIPAEGSNLGVSDMVEFTIETEFNGPAWERQEP